jgi:hypothetical protein
MAKATLKIPEKYRAWIDARNRFHLTDTQVQMARELGLNPNKLEKLAHENEAYSKKPLPEYIEETYLKRFDNRPPEGVRSIEQIIVDQREKKAERKAGQDPAATENEA